MAFKTSDDLSLRESRVININRVAKVVKGGRRFSFTALVVIGDGAGRVGLGYGKAGGALAIQKGTEEAKRNLFSVAMAGHDRASHHRCVRSGSRHAQARIARYRSDRRRCSAILEEAGIQDVLCKSMGSASYINVAKATINGLQELRRPEDIAALRGLPEDEIIPGGLLRAYNETRHGAKPDRDGED
ncbi:MAG: 30S ribosomal protein S5 [Microthrixaceae bacterium]